MEQSTWTKLDWVFELPLQYLAALEMPPNAKYILCRRKYATCGHGALNLITASI